MFDLFLGCAIQTALGLGMAGLGMAVIATPLIVLFRPEWVPVILTIYYADSDISCMVSRGWGDLRFRPLILTLCPASVVIALVGAITH